MVQCGRDGHAYALMQGRWHAAVRHVSQWSEKQLSFPSNPEAEGATQLPWLCTQASNANHKQLCCTIGQCWCKKPGTLSVCTQCHPQAGVSAPLHQLQRPC